MLIEFNAKSFFFHFKVHLVSEHVWCEDYLVRSVYLKNTRTGETRTVTQFHFRSWPAHGVPSSTKALLEFRRKVNKSYRGRSCPIGNIKDLLFVSVSGAKLNCVRQISALRTYSQISSRNCNVHLVGFRHFTFMTS